MAVGFLNNVDLNNNQVLNMRLQNLGTAPTGAGAAAGSIYFNSATDVNRPTWHDGTSWYQIYPASSDTNNNFLVLRDGAGKAYANAFVGPLTGTADTATKLVTTKNIGITGKATATAAAFDGSANVNIDITGLSVAASDISLTNGSFIIGNGSNVGAATAKSAIPLSGFGAATAEVAMGGYKLTGLAEPINASDAATKAYVDAAAVGLKVKEAAKYATTAALAAYSYTSLAITATGNGALTVDGQTPAVNDRILVKNETSTNAKRNGIYTVTQVGTVSTPFILTRATDFDNSAEASPGSFVFVTNGDTLANTGWVMSAAGPITLDTSDIVWSQFSGTGQIDAGDGLTKAGNRIDVVGTAGRISVGANNVDIDSTYVGQASITTLGTIATGTWSATTIAVNKGGTGLTSYAVGDIIYASASTTLAKLAASQIGNVLVSKGVNTAPQWDKVELDTMVSKTLQVANGGTGATSLTANGILLGNGTSAITASTTSTAGQFLISAATNFIPTWRSLSGDATLAPDGALTIANGAVTYSKFQPVSGYSVVGNATGTQATASAITAANDHQVFRRSGTSLGFGAINLASSNAVSGILPVANGGTGLSSYNTGSLLYASGSTAIAQIAAVATGSVLLSNGVSAVPSWGKVDLTTHVNGILAVDNGGTGASTLAAKGVLLGNGGNAVSSSVAATAGQLLVAADTTIVPTWRSLSGDATLNGSGALTIAANAVTYGKFQPVAALSVVGNSTNSQANAAAINAANDHQVLRRSGTSIGFGAINLSSVNAVTGALPGANGGTGSQHFTVAGPSAARIYTFNDANCNIPAIFAATIAGNGTATTFSVQHNIGSRDVSVQIYQAASPYAQVFTDIEATNNNAVAISFSVAPANGVQYRVVVIGSGTTAAQ